MVRQVTHMLIALIVALATVLSVNVHAMPMSADMSEMGIQRHCLNCPDHSGTTSNPDEAPACQVLACTSAVAVLPSPALLPEHVLLQVAYLAVSPVRWTAAARAPDPFPPRPIALV